MSPSRRPAALPLAALLLFAGATARAYDAQRCAEHEGELCDENDAEEAAALAEPAGPEVTAPLPPPNPDSPFETAVKDGLGEGNWGVEFVLVEPAGQTHVLARMNHEKSMVPASTMKLFTGWFGFIKDQAARRAFPAPFRTFLSYAATMIRSSVNPMANRILKIYGGASSMERFYAELGLPADALKVVDGAGLSGRNRASARAEVALLDHILRSPHYMEYRGLMAQPGASGTLRGRLPSLQGMLYAKTGTLPNSGVASLAGFIDVGNAGTVLFSIIGNNSRVPVDTQKARIDRVVVAVHGLAAPRPVAAAARRSPAPTVDFDAAQRAVSAAFGP